MRFLAVSAAAPVLSLALVLAGCQTAAMTPVTLVAADGTACPGAEEFDVDQIRIETAPMMEERNARIAEYTSVTPIPPESEGAATTIRVRVPTTGRHQLDTMLTLWKDASGTWWAADASKNYAAPPPSPIPIYNDAGEMIGAEYPEPPPYVEGPIAPERAQALDEILADPCFIRGPDWLPYEVPVRTPGTPPHPYWTCPPDSAGYMAELIEPGRPSRFLSQACYMDFAVSGFLTLVAYTYPVQIPDTP